MLEVTTAEYVDGYKIRVEFNNGEAGVVDLKDCLWGPMFEPLWDVSVFKRFSVSEVLHTVRWEHDADLAPEFLYDKTVEQADGPERRQNSSGGRRGGRRQSAEDGVRAPSVVSG